MHDDYILTIAFSTDPGDAGDLRRMKALIEAWNRSSPQKYSLEHNFIKFPEGDPGYLQFKKHVGAALPRSCPLEERIRRRYAAPDLAKLRVFELHLVGTGVDGSSTAGASYAYQGCERCHGAVRTQVAPLRVNLRKARGKDFISTYGDWEAIVSDRARRVMEKAAPGCCAFERIMAADRAPSGAYFRLQVLPTVELAVPPMRIRRSRRCSACGRSRETLRRGESILKSAPPAPISRSDIEFGESRCSTPALFIDRNLLDVLGKSRLTGWTWDPAWVLTDLRPSDVRRLVPKVDVLEVDAPRRRVPRWVWEDPDD